MSARESSRVQKPGSGVLVPRDDINFTVPEPLEYFQTHLSLKIHSQVAKKSKTKGDIRFDPDFWFGEGFFKQSYGD